MSTDEESDCVVICPPNRNSDHEEVVSCSHDEILQEGNRILML
jgi:hypothetical protein